MNLEDLYQSNSCDKDCSSKLLQDSNSKTEISSTSPAQMTQLVSDSSVRSSAPLVATGLIGSLESSFGAVAMVSGTYLAGKGVPFASSVLKGAGAGAGVHVLDYGINKMLAGGDENSWYALKAASNRPQSTIFQPNGLEALLVGASAAAPIKDMRIKAGLIGASWLAGRIDNYVELKVLKNR